MELTEVLTIKDVRTDVAKIMDYLDTCFFTDSTITLMNDEYIKKSVMERLSQIVMFGEGLATLNHDPKELSKAMLRSSLNDKDINFILGASLKISDVSVVIKDEKDMTDKEKADEETPENVDKMVKSKMESMGSLENLIGIIRDSLGTSRILPESSEIAIYEAMNANIEPENARKDMLRIERPIEFNLNYLDLSKVKNTQIFDFLNSLMASDSNSSLAIEFPMDALLDDIKTFYTVDLPAIAEAAVTFARTSTKNSFSFTKEPDAFETLFNTL